MARGRIITKEASVDPELNSISIEAMLLYVLTLPHLDRDGLIDGTPMRLAAVAAPLQAILRDRAGAYINEWIEVGLVIPYRSGKHQILFFKGFRKHQIKMEYSKDTPSIYPAPPNWHRTPEGIIPDDSELCFRLADGFHATSAYRRVLLMAARADLPEIEAGDGYLTNGIEKSSRSNRDGIENTSSQYQSKRRDIDDDDDQSINPSLPGYGNGGVQGGGGDLTDIPRKELIVVAYDLGGLLNLVTEWRSYQSYVMGLSDSDLVQLIEWIFYYRNQPEETITAIRSMPAVIQAHMKRNETAAFTTRERAELRNLVEKSLRLNQPQPRDDDEVDL